MKKQILLLLIMISLFSLPTILALGECKVSGEGFSKLTEKEDSSCKDLICYKVDGDNTRLNFEGVEGVYNIKKGSIVKCASSGELLPGTKIELGTKGFSDSYSVNFNKNGILLDGINPGDKIEVFESGASLTKIQNNVKEIGERGRKEFQVTPVTICGQKFDAPIGAQSSFRIDPINSKQSCRVSYYKIYGSELSKEVQSSSFKCGNRNLKLNGIALTKPFECDDQENKGIIRCAPRGCFENIAGYYNLDINGTKLQNLKGFSSYEYFENTGFSTVKGTDVIVDFKGANVYCNDDECLFKDKTLVYCPKSGVGKRKTGGLEIGLPGLKMFDIVSQKSDNLAVSQTGCFEVKTEGKLQSLTQQELGTLGVKKDTTKVNIPSGIDLDREFSGNIPVKITPSKGTGMDYDIEERRIGIQERIAKLKEEAAPQAGIPPIIKEVSVKSIGCTPPANQYYVPENNLPICLTEEIAKEVFEPICRHYGNACLNEDEIQKLNIKHITDLASNPSAVPYFQEIDDSIKKKITEQKECPAGTKNYGDPNLGEYLCIGDDEVREEFKDRREIKKEPDSLIFKPVCSEGKVFDSDYGCIDATDERIKKKLREIEKESSPEGAVDQIQSCGLGQNRCSKSVALYDFKTNNPYYFREECIYDEDKKLFFFNKISNDYYSDSECQEKLPEVGGAQSKIIEEGIPSCNLGSDRCSFDYDPFTAKTLFFKERCIEHKDIKKPTWGFWEGYYEDLNCGVKIKLEPEVTVVQDNELVREKLRGQTRRIKVQTPETAESIKFGRKVAPDLIKNKNRPAVTLQGYVDGLAVDEGNLGDIISAVADENNIDRTIIKSIIAKESSFNVNAVGSAGEAGLMQLMPHTAKGLGLRNIYRGDEFNEMYKQFTLGRITADAFNAFQKEYAEDLRKQIAGKSKAELALLDDRFDPEKNLNKGVSYFARAYQYSGGDLGLALVTYNAGLGFVQKNCKGTYESCSLRTNSPIRKYVDSVSKEIASGGPVLDTREKILAFVKSVPKEKVIKDLVALNNGDKKKAFEALGRMDIEPSFVQFSTYLKDAQLDLYSDPERQGIGKSSIIQNPQFIPQGVKITADLPRGKVFGIFGGSYTIERSSTALPLWRLRDSKGNVVSGLDNKELFEIFTSQPFAGGSINLPLGDEIRRFDIKSDPKTKVRYFVDKETKEELELRQMAEKIQKAKKSPEIRAPK